MVVRFRLSLDALCGGTLRVFFCLCAPSYQEQERARRKPWSAHAKNQHRVVCPRVKVKPRAVQATLTRSNRPHDARRIPETVSGNIPQPRNIGDWRFFNPSRNSFCGAFPDRETLGIDLEAWTALRPRESRTSGAGGFTQCCRTWLGDRLNPHPFELFARFTQPHQKPLNPVLGFILATYGRLAIQHARTS